jgi:hypothetical protein
MDPSSLAATLVGAQAGALQQQIATRVLKMNLDSQASVLQLLAPAQQNAATSAAVAPGIGGQLDISA